MSAAAAAPFQPLGRWCIKPLHLQLKGAIRLNQQLGLQHLSDERYDMSDSATGSERLRRTSRVRMQSTQSSPDPKSCVPGVHGGMLWLHQAIPFNVL